MIQNNEGMHSSKNLIVTKTKNTQLGLNLVNLHHLAMIMSVPFSSFTGQFFVFKKAKKKNS